MPADGLFVPAVRARARHVPRLRGSSAETTRPRRVTKERSQARVDEIALYRGLAIGPPIWRAMSCLPVAVENHWRRTLAAAFFPAT